MFKFVCWMWIEGVDGGYGFVDDDDEVVNGMLGIKMFVMNL